MWVPSWTLSMLLGLTYLGQSFAYNPFNEDKLFKKINKHLTQQVSSDDIEQNMDEAARWLAKMHERSTGCLFLFDDKELYEALELFLKLRKVVESKECNDANRWIVDQNDNAVWKPRVLADYSDPPKTRIAKIIYHYATRYYKHCYPDLISKDFDALPEDIHSKLLKLGAMGYSKGYIVPTQIIDLIRAETKKPRKHPEVTRDEFIKYVVEPCKELERVFGADLFADIEPQLKSYDKPSEEYLLIDKKRTALLQCQIVLKGEEKIWDDVQGLIDYEKNPIIDEYPIYVDVTTTPAPPEQKEERKGFKSRLLFMAGG